MVHLMLLPLAQTTGVKWQDDLLNNELERMPWSNLMYYLRIRLEGVKQTKKSNNWSGQCPGQH
jgi:hypothetical protein